MKNRYPIVIILIFLGFLLTRFFVYRNLGLVFLYREPILFFELFGHKLTSLNWINLLFNFGSTILIGLVSAKFASKKIACIASLVFAISPWSVYLSLTSSSVIITTFFLLLLVYGTILLKEKTSLLNVSIFVLGSIGFVFSNVLVLPIYLLLAGHLYFSKIGKNNSFIRYFITSSIILFFLLLIINFRLTKDILHREIRLFSDVGLINQVNEVQGIFRKNGLGGIGRIFENKFTYLGIHFLSNTLEHASPVTYFTNQYNLLGFSFTPPIFFAFLFCLFAGIPIYLKKYFKRYHLLFFIALLIPSIVSFQSPDLNKLYIFFPVLTLIISLGIDNFLRDKKKKIILALLILVLAFQIFVTGSDIVFREPFRLERYSSQR